MLGWLGTAAASQAGWQRGDHKTVMGSCFSKQGPAAQQAADRQGGSSGAHAVPYAFGAHVKAPLTYEHASFAQALPLAAPSALVWSRSGARTMWRAGHRSANGSRRRAAPPCRCVRMAGTCDPALAPPRAWLAAPEGPAPARGWRVGRGMCFQLAGRMQGVRATHQAMPPAMRAWARADAPGTARRAAGRRRRAPAAAERRVAGGLWPVGRGGARPDPRGTRCARGSERRQRRRGAAGGRAGRRRCRSRGRGGRARSRVAEAEPRGGGHGGRVRSRRRRARLRRRPWKSGRRARRRRARDRRGGRRDGRAAGAGRRRARRRGRRPRRRGAAAGRRVQLWHGVRVWHQQRHAKPVWRPAAGPRRRQRPRAAAVDRAARQIRDLRHPLDRKRAPVQVRAAGRGGCARARPLGATAGAAPPAGVPCAPSAGLLFGVPTAPARRSRTPPPAGRSRRCPARCSRSRST